MKILIVGSTGLLGSSFVGDDLLKPSRKEFDITNWDSMDRYLFINHVDVIVNCAALVGTVACEQNVSLAKRLNSLAVFKLSDLCKKYGIKLIHISTMYSGIENIYAETKLISEGIVERLKDHAVIRLPWIFGSPGKSSFLSQMISFVRDGLDLELFPDEGHVAYSKDIAGFIIDNVKHVAGKFDLYNDGVVTKKDVAKFISQHYEKSVLIKEIPRRIPLIIHPINSSYKLRHWKTALEEYLNESRAMQPTAENTLASR